MPSTVLARSHRDKGPVKPFTKISEDTISAVTATSITITHNKDTPPPQGKKPKDAPPAQAITMTYTLSTLSDIEVNGQPASVGDLKVGMFVQISADPPDGLDNTDPTNGGTARTIVAHDAEAGN